MLKTRNLPDTERLSVLAATILLAYALARFVDLPGYKLALQLPGIYLSVEITVRTFVALLVAALTASGADWLLRDHPALGDRSTLEHWLLPALTAWVIGLPLLQMPPGLFWWIGFALGGGLLMLVMVAEYIAIDPGDIRQPAAAASLIAVSFALYLALCFSLRFADWRLFLMVPTLMVTAFLVSLRALHLRLHGQWAFLEAIVIALIIGQLAAAFHYWPLSPVSFGMLLLGPAYGLTSLIARIKEGGTLRQAIVEPGIILVLVWGAAVWFR